jgi:hypothetical protein
MNFLQLVQRFHSEAGRQGTAPATVTGQTGMALRMVNYIARAYEEVQESNRSWFFRRADFSFPTIAGLSNYTPAAVSLNDLSDWHYDPDYNRISGIRAYLTVTDETDLVYLAWDDFKATYRFGSSRAQTGKPIAFSIKPDMSMEFWPIPDAVYTVNGEYIKSAASFTANDDVPVFNEFHMIIVHKALMHYGAFEGAPEIFSKAQGEYKALLMKLELAQLPRITWGAPLA